MTLETTEASANDVKAYRRRQRTGNKRQYPWGRLERTARLAAFPIVAAISLQDIILLRVLFADGAPFAYMIAMSHGHWIVDYNRFFAQAVGQFPAWLAVTAHVAGVEGDVFGLSVGMIGATAAVWLATF